MTTALKIGSLFSGYGGLDMAVEEVLNAETAWFVESDKAPARILTHHWSDTPNYGDITKVDWSTVEPVDVITGGSPCPDLSNAGKRQGMTEGTRSNLWVQMREAIAQLRPSYVVWENVRGAYSAPAHSDVELCSGCLGDEPGVVLRALHRVLGDLSDLGYDARWHGLRAADAGAPHERFRVFILATRDGQQLPPQHAPLTPNPGVLLGTPTARDAKGSGKGERLLESLRRGQVEAQVILQWETYAEAVAHWSRTFRPAPAPIETGLLGNARISPYFTEWMMGLPVGHVTDVPGLARGSMLKALGNGVVPQQAAAALRFLLSIPVVEVSA